MAATDFLMLYQELDLVPGCGIDDLKRAYRRCISRLHPDRARDTNTNAELATERLQRLTQLYNSAIDFHRRYGRLPGAAVARRLASFPAAQARIAPRDPRRRSKPIVIIVGIAILGSLLAYLASEDASAPEHRNPVDQAQNSAPDSRAQLSREPTAPVDKLALGLRMNEVLEIEGEPVVRDGDQWGYGPSWISFYKGKVAGWYSSPLRPLAHATTRSPPPSASEQ